MLPLPLTHRLTALRERSERGEAVASALGSLGAEGLKPTAQFVSDTNDFIDGQINADELARRAVARHRR